MISLLSALVLLCAQTPAPTAPPPAKLDQATRLAVDKALAWLASKQEPDGSWSDAEHVHNTAITSFAVLAFLSDGHMPGRGRHGETVLIIDDEETVRMLVAEVLGDAGYNVIEAPDGPSGLEILRSDRRIDLLVSDVGLPGGMNGRQVADAARVSRPDLKVLFITGYAENAAVGNGLLAPGMQVLTKPFVMGDLAAKVHDMIEG